jgi:hypothetical protein
MPKRSLLSKYRAVSRYTRKCDFIYAQEEVLPPPTHNFTKLANVKQYYVKVSYTKFLLNRPKNVESINCFTF